MGDWNASGKFLTLTSPPSHCLFHTLQSPLLPLHYILSCGLAVQIKNTLTSLISAGGGEWDSGAGAAGDTWNDGTDTGVNAGDDFGAANGEVVTNEAGGGDFTCRR